MGVRAGRHGGAARAGESGAGGGRGGGSGVCGEVSGSGGGAGGAGGRDLGVPTAGTGAVAGSVARLLRVRGARGDGVRETRAGSVAGLVQGSSLLLRAHWDERGAGRSSTETGGDESARLRVAASVRERRARTVHHGG